MTDTHTVDAVYEALKARNPNREPSELEMTEERERQSFEELPAPRKALVLAVALLSDLRALHAASAPLNDSVVSDLERIVRHLEG
jgi:hypothetical protein